MGLLDQILGGVGSALNQQTGGQGGGLLGVVMQLINSQPGGLQGLLAKLSEGGMGQQVQSWVSTGQNMPISADQLSQVLGGGQLQQLAQQFGLSQDALSGGLSQLLPDVVDKLTPNGELREDSIASGFEALRKGLGG